MVVYCSDTNPPPPERKPAEGKPFAAPAAPALTKEQAEAFGAGRAADQKPEELPHVSNGGSFV